jgi:hypothetical protein
MGCLFFSFCHMGLGELMIYSVAHDINQLVCELFKLQDRWEGKPGTFDWFTLQALATRGAHAHNEGAGLSFAAIAMEACSITNFMNVFCSTCGRRVSILLS